MASKVKRTKQKVNAGAKAGIVEKTVRHNFCGKESEMISLKKIALKQRITFSMFVMDTMRERHLK